MYPAPYGYGRSVWYLNTMGFAKHGWIVAKWALTVAVIVSFAILPYSTASVGAALVCVIALFAISAYKPGKKKAKAKPERAKAGKTNHA